MTNYKSNITLLILISLFIISNSLKELPTNYTKQTKDYNFKNKYDIKQIIYSPDQKFLIILENAKQQIQVYNGRRNDLYIGTLIINDTNFDNVSPNCITFNNDSNLLFIGTQQGAIYGYTIQNGIISTDFVYKKYFVTPNENENILRSLSITSDNKYIAVGGQKKVFLLSINQQQQILQDFKTLNFINQDIYSVSWFKDKLLIGGLDQNVGLFSIYDSTQQVQQGKNPSSINNEKTISVKFSPTGEYFLQGKQEKNMSIYNSADNSQLQSVPNTLNAKQIHISQNGQFMGIQSPTGVFIWKVKITEQSNLRNNLKAISIDLTPALSQTGAGLSLAFSQNGNSILIVTNLQTAQRYHLCLDGNYFNPQTNDCGQCKTDCDTCYSQNLCQSCKVGSYFKDQSCVQCSQSYDGCLECTQTECSKCDGSNSWKEKPENGKCLCEDKFYLENKQCKTCSIISHCQTCTSSNNCLTCSGDNFNTQAQNGVCVCLQKYTLYLDQCKLCSSLIDGCSICANTQECSLCDTVQHYKPTPDPVNHKCLCDNTYYFNTEDKKCALCSTKISQCQQCTQDGSQCNLCKSGDHRITNQDKTQCICDKFYFQNNQSKICQKCDEYQKCQKCQNTESCQVCNKENNWVLNNQTNLCKCMDGFYQDGIRNICVQCDVIGCSKCSQNGECDSCSTEKGFNPDAVDNVCSCITSRYLNPENKVCDLCHDAINGCQQCTQKDKCTKCDHQNNFNQTSDNQCACNYGYFINTNNNTQCLKCSDYNLGCIDCTGEKKCKKCNTKAHFYQDAKEGECKCVDTYYKNTDKKQCTLCSSSITNCLNCQLNIQNKPICTSCEDGFDLSSDKSRCQQVDGLSPLVVIAIIIGILALAGGVVAIIKCCKKRNSPLEDDQYQALEEK